MSGASRTKASSRVEANFPGLLISFIDRSREHRSFSFSYPRWSGYLQATLTACRDTGDNRKKKLERACGDIAETDRQWSAYVDELVGRRRAA